MQNTVFAIFCAALISGCAAKPRAKPVTVYPQTINTTIYQGNAGATCYDYGNGSRPVCFWNKPQ